MEWLVFPAFVLVLLPTMLDLEPASITEEAWRPELLATALVLNLMLSPALICALTWVFLSQAPVSVLAGVTIFGLVPCGSMVPAFTGMLRGRVGLAVAITVSSLVLSVATLPLWMVLLLGKVAAVPAGELVKHLLLILLAPLLAAQLVRVVLTATRGRAAFVKIRRRLQAVTGLGLVLLELSLFGLRGDLLLDRPLLVLKVVLPVVLFVVVLLCCSTVAGACLRAAYPDAVALTISTAPRNGAVAAVIAASAFGEEAALVVIICAPFVQLPLMLAYLRLRGRAFAEVTTTRT